MCLSALVLHAVGVLAASPAPQRVRVASEVAVDLVRADDGTV